MSRYTKLSAIAVALMLALLAGPVLTQEEDTPDESPTAEATQATEQAPARVVPENRMQVQLSYAPVVRQVEPAVVNIFTRQVVQVQSSPLFNDPLFRQFFGDNLPFGMPRERVQGSLGSGVLVRDNGVIVTNNHVIGGADSIRVVLHDRREFDAQIVLADERTDLAVLKIDVGDEKLPYLDLRDSDHVEVGDIVLAIGNPFGVGQTVTSGIVSATARTQVGISDYQFFIQTDAAVNPGNSGGALVGLDGRLIGINSAIYSRTGTSSGIGFAIPANMVNTILKAALDEGRVERPWIGASGQGVDATLAESLGLDRPGGVLINDVYPDGPAAKAGIQPGDVILKVGEWEIIDPQGLRFRIATADMDAPVNFEVYRQGERLTLPVTLEIPPEIPERDVTELSGRNPFQGVTVANLSPRYADELGLDTMAKGVIVTAIDRRSPAARRQFVRPGDIILSLNDVKIELVSDLVAALEEPSQDWVYELRRGGRSIECGIIANRSFYCR